MADGRQFEKPLNRHISATAWPILMKFATVMQIGLYRGRTVEILIFCLKNHKNRDISWTVWLIFTKFGTIMQNGSLNRSA